LVVRNVHGPPRSRMVRAASVLIGHRTSAPADWLRQIYDGEKNMVQEKKNKNNHNATNLASTIVACIGHTSRRRSHRCQGKP
jgi:hypothetical protein